MMSSLLLEVRMVEVLFEISTCQMYVLVYTYSINSPTLSEASLLFFLLTSRRNLATCEAYSHQL